MKKYDSIRAYEISIQIIKSDPLYFDIIPVYCASLLDLNYLGELYYCAHNLIENYPNHQLSWYAIGVYYFLIKKYEVIFHLILLISRPLENISKKRITLIAT